MILLLPSRPGQAGDPPDPRRADRTEHRLNFFVMLPPAASADLALRPETNPHRPPGHLHMTVQPLGDRWRAGDADLAVLTRALAAVTAPPFRVVFDQISGHAGRTILHASEPVRGALAFHGRFVAALNRAGITLPRYRFQPHVTLDYRREWPGRRAIDPVSWLVEEVLLIESVHDFVGGVHRRTRHVVRARSPLRRPVGSGYRAA